MPTDPGDNLLSLNPFKHRKFKLRSIGKGPPGPPNLESWFSVMNNICHIAPFSEPRMG